MNMKSPSKQIFKFEAKQPGPSLAIFAGVHGDEKAGVWALQELLPKLQPTRGTLYLAFANPPAIKKNVRLVTKNLNRCFFKGNHGSTYEDKRARQLMAVLDECEALLDLHAFNDKKGVPFIICEENALNIAAKLNPTIISTNWSEAVPGGSDGYMYKSGKVGICLECGSISKSKQFQALAVKTVKQFLRHFQMLDTDVEFSINPKRITRANYSVIRTSKDYHLKSGMTNFQELKSGEVYSSQDGKDFVARKGECIIFPRPDAKIGAEAFVIGREIL